MEIIQSFKENHLEVSIVGELDASSAIQMDEVMNEALEKKNFQIIIDCAGLDYISSAGLGVFVSYIEDIKSHEGNMVFYNLSDKVLNVFQILGLDQLVSIVPTQADAIQIIDG